MQTFKLFTGYTVTTQRDGEGVAFVTRNPAGEVISSVTHSFAESVPLIKRLRCNAVAV